MGLSSRPRKSPLSFRERARGKPDVAAPTPYITRAAACSRLRTANRRSQPVCSWACVTAAAAAAGRREQLGARERERASWNFSVSESRGRAE